MKNDDDTSSHRLLTNGSVQISAARPRSQQHHDLAPVEPVDDDAAERGEEEARAACARP